MRKCFRNDEKCARFHLNHGRKNSILMVVLFLFTVGSVGLLIPGRGTDHDSGRTSSELTVQETTEENVVTTSYVDAEGNLTCAIDKHYTTIVKTLDEEGRIIEERYLDEQEKPTGYYGYYGISYAYEGNEVKITYLDKDAILSLLIGLRLYAIAEEPICDFSNGSSTSFRCCRRRISFDILCALAAIPARIFKTLVSTLRE